MTLLHFNHHWQDHRTTFGLDKDELTQIIANLVLDVAVVGLAAIGLVADDGLDLTADLLDKFFLLAHIDEAAGDDVRGLLEFAGTGVDDAEDDEDAVLCERLAVADDYVLYVADGESVHEHEA